MTNDRQNARHTLRGDDADLAKREEELKRQKEIEKQLHSDRCKLLKMPEFQRVMADILAKGGMLRSVMTGSSQTYYLSGRQDFTREIWADMATANNDLAFELLKPKFGES